MAAACTVQPLTPTPPSPTVLPAAVVVQVTFTSTPTSPATKTSVPIPTLTSSPEPSAAPLAAVSAPNPAPQAVIPTQPPAAAGPSDTPAPPLEAPTAVPAVDTAPAPAAPAPVAGDAAAAEQYTIDLINGQRAAAGVPALIRDETLMGIARARVADMIARGYTGHNDPVTGAALAREMMRAAGYASVYVGENWYGSIRPPPGIVDVAMGWFMTDPPHARNILSPNYVGVGVGIGYNGRQWLLIQNFAGAN